MGPGHDFLDLYYTSYALKIYQSFHLCLEVHVEITIKWLRSAISKFLLTQILRCKNKEGLIHAVKKLVSMETEQYIQ